MTPLDNRCLDAFLPLDSPFGITTHKPGVISEGAGEIAIAVDCSGSVSRRQLGLFQAEVRTILEAQRPNLVHVLYFDTEVHRAETYQAGQTINLTPTGGGGTNFEPCFAWLNERGIVPQNLIFLTDLCGTFPDEAPTYPVLWASTETRHAPFGKVIPMQSARQSSIRHSVRSDLGYDETSSAKSSHLSMKPGFTARWIRYTSRRQQNRNRSWGQRQNRRLLP